MDGPIARAALNFALLTYERERNPERIDKVREEEEFTRSAESTVTVATTSGSPWFSGTSIRTGTPFSRVPGRILF